MIKRVKKFISDLSLKRKILIITIVVNILLVSMVSIFGMNIVIKANNKQLYQSIASSLSYSATDIEALLDSVQTLSNIMIADDVIQNQLSIIKSSDHNAIIRGTAYKLLYTTIQSYFSEFKKNHISYISLYNDYFTTNTYTPLAEKTSDVARDLVITNAIIANGAPVWTTIYSKEYGLFLSRAVRKIQNLNLDLIGVLNICLNLDAIIEETTDFSNQYEASSYLLFDHNELIYNSKELSVTDAQVIAKMLKTDSGVITLNHHKYFAVKGKIPTFGWDYICLVSYDETYQSILLSYRLYALFMLASIIVSIALSEFLIHPILKHFDNLIHKMKTFRGNEAELIDVGYDYQNRGDELGLLHRQFGSMASEIQELIKVNYINQLLVKDSQIKALESQINPHFLYNILESVNWRAKAIGEKQISLMVESLGSLLRVTLNNKDEHFSLKQELELVQNYMTIQQIRFEEQLLFKLTVNNQLLNASIPKLTIQPLVENAIHYSLEKNIEACYIQITVVCINTHLVIYVKNSGSQFEPNLLEKLANKEIEPHGFGIGLLNINSRLKLTFGEAYGLSFYNESETAVAKIEIPFQPIV